MRYEDTFKRGRIGAYKWLSSGAIRSAPDDDKHSSDVSLESCLLHKLFPEQLPYVLPSCELEFVGFSSHDLHRHGKSFVQHA